ncbi:MAG: HD domain-containing protein [Deltaproteobacteria bacterium]|nr:HD domain-containing protein [Deltaproteobacteria bacterium]MBW2661724.1 HD domain-containing protein [Deltaproteobacteria bacterium]
MKDNIEIVKARAEKLFIDARGSHDWDHTLRVGRLCERIGHVEGADMKTLLIAAYLHDIGRSCQDASNGAVCHAEKGAMMAQPIIKDLPFSKKQKENIIHCIKAHRFRGNNAPKSIEAKVLFDADKLDAIGAIGVARAYLFAGELGARLHSPEINVEEAKSYSKDDTGYREFKVKLNKIQNKILTGEGRKIAKERHSFMEAFFKRFLEEYDGIR